MARGRLYLVAPLVALGLFGCRAFNYEERAPWRAAAEEQCIAQRLVQTSAYAEPVSEISGPGSCGMNHPFKIEAVANGFVAMQPKATLGCPMVAAFNRWLTDIAQPAALAWFGEEIIEVKQLSSFSCRRIGGSGTMSEHGYGNAPDVAGFVLKGGRTVTVKHGWRGAPDERGFLRQVHAGGCEVFTTVLGPGYDAAHHDHFHFDLARRNAVVCRPTPEPLASPPPLTPRRHYENVPVAQRQQQQVPQRFPIARVQPQTQQQSDYEDDDDVPQQQPQRFPVARQKNQPLAPDQAYPPPPSQQRAVNQPLVLNPQDPNNYPPPGNPQYMQAPNGPVQQPYPQPQYQQPVQQAPVHPQPQMQWQQGPQPAPDNPNRPVPPQRIGSKANADQTVTGSIKNRKHYKELPEPKKNLPKAVPGED
jgi:hypothetical protein